MSVQETRFALDVPIEGDFADPARLAGLARDAEAAGWDGFFVMDHVIRRQPWKPMVDPWVAMSAIACSTESILLGPMVTPLARRRTSVLARQTVTLDLLSEGRLILGVGLGAPDDEFTRFGESSDPKLRARKLDESLELLNLLWSGEEVEYRGEHVMADGVQFLPRPVSGQIPVWVAGAWPGGPPFRRAARHDGVWPITRQRGELTIDEFADCVAAIRDHRSDQGDDMDRVFDYCHMSMSEGPDDEAALDRAGRLVELGMTWWIEPLDYSNLSFGECRERVLAGPPR